MRRTVLFILILVGNLTCCWAAVEDDVAQLAQSDLPAERRDALVTALSSAPFSEVMPRILPLLVMSPAPAEPGMGPKPWLSDAHSERAKIWYAAGAVWQSHLRGSPDPRKTATLLSLLSSAKDVRQQDLLIRALEHQWDAAAEKPLLDILAQPSAPPNLRVQSAKILLHHSDIRRYFEPAMQLLTSLPPEKSPAAFQEITNLGYKTHQLSSDQLRALARFGFGLLAAAQVEGKDTSGYFLARRLGFILQIPGEFSPDQKSPKYNSGHGLTDDFFKDTERNAMIWYSANKSTLLDR